MTPAAGSAALARLVRAGVLAALVALATVGGTRAALAHAALVGTRPAADATLAAPPAEIELAFNEPVRPLAFQVLGPAGERLADRAALRVEGERLRATLPAGLGEGTYLVSFRVISVDSHLVEGSFPFTVGAASTALSPRPQPGTGAVPAGWAARLALYLGLVLGVGAALVEAWSGLPPADHHERRVTVALLLLGGIAGAAGVALHGLHLLGDGPAALLGPAPWHAGLDDPAGRAAFLAGFACVFLAALVAGADRVAHGLGAGRRLGVGLLGALAIGSLALAGHVATAAPRGLTGPALVLHAGCAALWIGSLLPLLRRARDEAGSFLLLERFSTLAPWIVAALAVTGTTMAAVQLGGRLPTAPGLYAAALAVKLLAVAGLLLLAARNRWRIVPALRRADGWAAPALRRAIAAELALALLVLGATAALHHATPPRALAGTVPPAPIRVAVPLGRGGATVTFEPLGARAYRVGIALSDATGRPLHPLEVGLELAAPAAGIAPLRVAATGAGHAYAVPRVVLPVEGIWQVRVDALVTEFERADGAAEVALP